MMKQPPPIPSTTVPTAPVPTAPVPVTPYGVFSVKLLRRGGITRHHLTRLLERDELIRLRHGWYATVSSDKWVRQAVSAGGQLSGLHRLKLLHRDIWLPERARAHLYTNRTLTDPPAIVHTRPALLHEALQFGVVPPIVALRHGLQDASLHEAVAVTDSLLRFASRRPASRSAYQCGMHVKGTDVFAELRHTRLGRAVLPLVDTRAESGLESIVRVLLTLAGHRVDPQVELSNGQRIDLVVDGVLAVELNGQEHRTHHRFHADHRKDIAVREAGYENARYTYEQVIHNWPAVYEDIRQRLAAA